MLCCFTRLKEVNVQAKKRGGNVGYVAAEALDRCIYIPKERFNQRTKGVFYQNLFFKRKALPSNFLEKKV